MPGNDNQGIVIECGCGSQTFKVSWIAAPVASTRMMSGSRFEMLAVEGRRLTPRYALECGGCGVWMLAPPDGPDPGAVRGGVNNN